MSVQQSASQESQQQITNENITPSQTQTNQLNSSVPAKSEFVEGLNEIGTGFYKLGESIEHNVWNGVVGVKNGLAPVLKTANEELNYQYQNLYSLFAGSPAEPKKDVQSFKQDNYKHRHHYE